MVITSRSIEIDREQHARTRHNWHVRCMRTFCLLPPPSSVWHAGSAALLLSYRYPPRGATRTPPHGSWGPRTAHERPQRVAMQARVPFGSRFASRDLPVRWARVRGARENRVRGSPVSAVCCVCVVCVCVCVCRARQMLPQSPNAINHHPHKGSPFREDVLPRTFTHALP